MKRQHDKKTGWIIPWTAETFRAVLVPTATGCLEWPGHIEKNGYGRTGYKNERILTHQLAWILAGNERLRGHKFELSHSCHNRKCCNLAHISKQTSSGNKMMSSRDGRLPAGKTHPRARARLTHEQVLEIKKLLREGWMPGELAKRFPTTRANISQIKRGFSWKEGQF